MKAKLQKIGHSRGIVLPKPILDVVGIENLVDISVENNKVIITPIVEKLPVSEEISLAGLDDWNNPEESRSWDSLQ